MQSSDNAIAQLVPGLRIYGSGQVELNAASLGSAAFLYGKTQGHAAERPLKTRRDDRPSTMCVFLGVREKAEFRHCGQVATMRTGDMLVVDSDRGFSLESARNHAQTILQFPKRALGARVALLQRVAGPALEGDDPRFSAIFSALTALGRLAPTLRGEEHLSCFGAALHIIDLFGRSDTNVERLEARRQRARAFIEAHLGNAGLCADDVARSLGVSRRALDLAFAESGTTVARAIWEQRLDRAAQLLAGDVEGQKLLALAAGCGFTCAAHFSRMFRAKHGVSPSAYRAACRGQASPLRTTKL